MAQSPYRLLGNKSLAIAAQVRRINNAIGSVMERCSADVAETLFIQTALVAAEVREQAPVQSGLLKSTVRVEEIKNGNQFACKIKVGGPTTKVGVTEGKAGYGYKYDYARAVEFGTQNERAHPFFFPIWRARRKGVRAAVKKAIKHSVVENFK